MTEITTKTCSKCKVEKPIIDYCQDNSTRSGLSGYCKLCRAENKKKYRAANPEKLAQAEKFRSENTEKEAARRKKYRLENPGIVAASCQKWRAANPEKVKAIRAARWASDKTELTDAYIRSRLCQHEKISCASIPQSLIELKRTQIQISNYLKEQAK